ncbi:MAG TPA: DUF5666 domain-containing protein [Gammaproteobacteria bacterium]|nr:DUF5666 domain-containing protein [Gammaproteobacteria bacterium]
MTQSQPVTSTGVITGFGSIYVNGARYDIGGARVEFEGEGERPADDLKLGMKVRVEGTIQGGARRADHVLFDDDLKGPAMNVTPDAAAPSVGTFTVLGQTVTVDADTVFDDDVGDNNGDGAIDISDLVLTTGTMVVEVSGLIQDGGARATRIERVNDRAQPGVEGDEFEVKGVVDSVATDGLSFTVNGTPFTVDGGTVFEDGLMANADLHGVFVEVKADDVSGTLVAVKVQREDGAGERHAGEFEIEGILQSVDTGADPDTITIGGRVIPVTDASSLAALIGQKVEITGTFNADGVLVLGKTEQEAEDTVRTEDAVADVGSDRFTTRLGLVIIPTGNSRVEDDAASDGDHLTPEAFLASLQAGDRIRARGIPSTQGVQWTRVERREGSDPGCRLRGPVETVDAGSSTLVIQGVTVDASGSSVQFEGINDQSLNVADFFSQVSVGDTVEASTATETDCQSKLLMAHRLDMESGGEDSSGNDG